MSEKRIIIFLLSFITISAIGQVKSDSTLADSSEIEVIKLKFDTLSYAEEYRRDYWRYHSGWRVGLSNGKYQINENIIDRINTNGLPVLDNNGKIIKNSFINNQTYNMGYNVGIFMRMVRGSFMFQPEVSYSVKGGRFDVLNSNGSLYKRVNGQIHSIDVPTLIGVRSKNSRVFFGPTFNFPFKMNSAMKDVLKDYVDNSLLNHKFFKRPILNFNVGLGYEFGAFFFDIRFEKGIKSYSVQTLGPANSPKIFDLMSDAFHINIGYIRK
jgi:hypothetical protein